MTVGTRSVLFGAHCLLVHPFFLALAWWKLYGFPWDPRLWAALFLHDIGYVGKPNMDGPEGERHPIRGALVMSLLFDWGRLTRTRTYDTRHGEWSEPRFVRRWYDFTLLHSRTFARLYGLPISRLCVADKLAFVLTPSWLYLPMARATGELQEYKANALRRGDPCGTDREWHLGVQMSLAQWVRDCDDPGAP